MIGSKLSSNICRLGLDRGTALRLKHCVAHSQTDNGASTVSEHAKPDILTGLKTQDKVALTSFGFEKLVCIIPVSVTCVRRLLAQRTTLGTPAVEKRCRKNPTLSGRIE